ncbi:MAG: spore maturation protein [Ruminococcus sp.]|nr:spore maturation protein [Ruminococcus sp.]MBQ1594863.1 spore maturation protein [Ruminococcus sp.]MBQ2441812.1 spore maturation protein [Ruminococcus sp.]
MELAMPIFACVIVLFGLIRRVPVFDIFMVGAREGIRTLYNIAPTIIGLMFAVSLLKSSGAVDVICSAISPIAQRLGFPPEIVPMAMLRPVSGSGATALLLSVFGDCGTDSFAGRVASVLAGSSETTFYATAMYFGSVHIKNTRHTLPAALAADFTALVMSVVTVRLFFY